MTSTTLNAEESRLLGIFKALANPARYRMVLYMVEHPQCITGEIAEFSGLAQATTSQHLAVLRESGLVRGVTEGPATCYCLDEERLAWFRTRVNEVVDQLAGGCCTTSR